MKEKGTGAMSPDQSRRRHDQPYLYICSVIADKCSLNGIILKLTALGRFYPLMQPHVYFEFTKTINISQKYPLNLFFSIYAGYP